MSVCDVTKVLNCASGWEEWEEEKEGTSALWREAVAELNTEGSVQLQRSSKSAHLRCVCTWEDLAAPSGSLMKR